MSRIDEWTCDRCRLIVRGDWPLAWRDLYMEIKAGSKDPIFSRRYHLCAECAKAVMNKTAEVFFR